jgi:hypothetical protein
MPKPWFQALKNPKLLESKRLMLGNRALTSVGLTPSQLAKVAAIWSTLVVGIKRP